jgi:hypothetical protein
MNLSFMEDMRSIARSPDGKRKRRSGEHNEMSVRELRCNGILYFWVETIDGLLFTGNGALRSVKGGKF